MKRTLTTTELRALYACQAERCNSMAAHGPYCDRCQTEMDALRAMYAAQPEAKRGRLGIVFVLALMVSVAVAQLLRAL